MRQGDVISATPSPLLVCDFPTYSSNRHSLELTIADSLKTPQALLFEFPIDILTVLYLSIVYTSRISEILDIRYADYLGNNRFVIHGKKHSNSYSALINSAELGILK